MGLDMYLSRKTYVKNWDYMDENEKHQVEVKKGNKEHAYIKPELVSSITEEVGYWRKANSIHGWFVREVQGGMDDCREYYVDITKLEELHDICVEVMTLKTLTPAKREAKLKKMLPTTQGFFFGSEEYNEYYFDDIESTINIIKPLLELNEYLNNIREQIKKQNNPEDIRPDYPDYYYQSSW